MKKSNWIVISNLLITILLVLTGTSVRCRDPYDFEPIFDSLTPPPGAPVLLHPCNDTIFRKYPFATGVIFEWSYIDGAQYYFFEISTTSTFIDPEKKQIQTTVACCSVGVSPTPLLFYYWRVRAYSKSWWWFTDWSETWHFCFINY